MNTTTHDARLSSVLLAEAEATSTHRHWLLDSIYGRGLLELRLSQLVPSIQLSIWGCGDEFTEVLEYLVDDLGLRQWKKPARLRQRLDYLNNVFRLILRVRRGAAA
ncbi:hypothetical protein [Caenimonas koreensis]|uniref:hypothetical protein n=1 Tax=Caenimonas koreensis TaxID=367474 RepID=UPI00188F2CB8|nr:hypothetical protein [Caenimonas koreensis]